MTVGFELISPGLSWVCEGILACVRAEIDLSLVSPRLSIATRSFSRVYPRQGTPAAATTQALQQFEVAPTAVAECAGFSNLKNALRRATTFAPPGSPNLSAPAGLQT